ncbi:MAG: bilin reductase [Oscillospiraceae bacterium]|nr:bilin reductase [Oscillospiraceae bacterium]
MSTIFEINKNLIETRLETGLETLRKYYTVTERTVPEEFRKMDIQNMHFEVQQYDVAGVGNLLLMKCTDSEIFQMDSFVLTPYFKNLPLFTTDYMYNGENRSYINEIYDVVDYQDALYLSYIEKFKANDQKHTELRNMPPHPGWYDAIRPVCTAKLTKPVDDDENMQIFAEHLATFIEMEQNTPAFSEKEAYQKKWKCNKDYADRLVEEGGISTDVFKKALGAETAKRFFSQVFFGTELYKN